MKNLLQAFKDKDIEVQKSSSPTPEREPAAGKSALKSFLDEIQDEKSRGAEDVFQPTSANSKRLLQEFKNTQSQKPRPIPQSQASRPKTLPKLADLFRQEGENTVLHFFLLDLQEQSNKLYLTGVAKHQNRVVTTSILVQNMCKVLYFPLVQGTDQTLAQQEIQRVVRQKCGIQGVWRGKMVDRFYQFQIKGLPRGKARYYKVTYFADDKKNKRLNIRADWSGKHFHCIIGTQYRISQLFVIKRGIKGPSWLSIHKDAIEVSKSNFALSGLQLVVNNYKMVIPAQTKLQDPKLRIMTFSVKYMRPKDIKNQQVLGAARSETEPVILCIAAGVHDSYNTDINVKEGTLRLKSFSLNALKYNINPRSNCLHNKYLTQDEVINNFLAYVLDEDPDFLVCHDVFSNSLDAVISRAIKRGVKAVINFGRLNLGLDIKSDSVLRRKQNATKGRLVVDTFVFSKDQMRLKDYSLSELSSMLSQKMQDLGSDEMRRLFQVNSQKEITLALQKIIEHTVQEAKLTFELMSMLEVLQLTKQLTCICGNLWRRSLQNQRAQRNQLLIMHKIHKKKYIIPDKFSKRQKQEDEPKKKKYEGGLVLQPRKGLYHDYVILLDFNSLYPSIIRQYNICFSTVKRRLLPLSHYLKPEKEGQPAQNVFQQDFKAQPPIQEERGQSSWGFLPKILQEIVVKRKQKKKQMDNTKDPKRKKVLDITQKAYKLVANSIYGCLGFSSSRFYAQDLAALITRKGRQTLQFAESKAKQVQSIQIIYGDTDSIMLRCKNSSEQNMLLKVLKPIEGLIFSINKVFKKLEIAVDGVFKPMLLLKKKKYAALKLNNLQAVKRGEFENYQPEYKGIDMVRRDWSQLSREASERVLNIILREKNLEKVRESIYEYLRELSEKIQDVTHIQKFLISKQLTKHPNEYKGSGESLPHVAVAKRRMERGETANMLINHMIYYLVCKGQGPLGDRAFDDKQYKQSQKSARPLQIDLVYYKRQQIMPPLERLVGEIPQLDPFLFAYNLGLNADEYKGRQTAARQVVQANHSFNSKYFDQFNERFKLKCFNKQCKSYLLQQNCFIVTQRRATFNSTCFTGSLMHLLANKILVYLRQSINSYFTQELVCKNSSCDCQWNQFVVQKCPRCGKLGKRTVELSKISSFLYEILKIIERKDEQCRKLKDNRETLRQLQQKLDQVLQYNSQYEILQAEPLSKVFGR